MAQKPAHESRADALGEHREVIRRNGPGRQELGAVGVGVRPEQAVGRARMEVDVAVEAGAEKIGDGSEFRLVSRGSVEAFEPSHVREILRPSGGSLVGKQMAF